MPLLPIFLGAHLVSATITASLATYNISQFRSYPMFKTHVYSSSCKFIELTVGFYRTGSGKCFCDWKDTLKHPHNCPTEPPTNHIENFIFTLCISLYKWPVVLLQNCLLAYGMKTNQMETRDFPLEEDHSN